MIILSATQGNYVNAEKRECGDLKWGDKAHDDNSPSTKEFKKSAYTDNLCELAKKVDHEQVSNHDSVDWKKFKSSPAYITATSEQKECLNKAHKEGNGMDGLGGYEILYCGIDND
jgi:hypothetical protein